MASDNYDDFDIDIYGNDEASPDASNEQQAPNEMDIKDESASQNTSPQATESNQQASETQPSDAMHVADNADQPQAQTQKIKDETAVGDDGNSHTPDANDAIAPTQEMENLRAGEKSPAVNPSSAQKAPANDDRPLDPGATSALIISDMMWWNTDNEITGWAVESGCEQELKDITFCEHKQNGKSKGQAYLEFSTPQAATALKRHIESSAFSEPNESQPVPRKYSVAFSSPHSNPYRTGPKDTAARQQFSQQPNNLGNQPARGPSNFRGRGAMNPRGNFGRGGFSNTPPQMKAQPQMGNFGGGGMGNFGAGGMGNMGANFGNFGRGGNMSMMNGFGGMRGGMAGPNAGGMGRGGMGMMGMNPMGMGGMPMQGMNMGMMPQGMGNMGGMGMGMGPNQFGGMPFMNQQGQGQGLMGDGSGSPGGENWNPHGAKRQRPE